MRTYFLLPMLAILVACGSDSRSPAPRAQRVIVTLANLDVDWSTNDTRPGGMVEFNSGVITPPLFGDGFLELNTTDSLGGSGEAKAQMFNYDLGSLGEPDAGVLLSELSELGYWAYRDSASTNSAAQTISLNIEVDFVGDGSSYTTFVYEPTYNGAQQAMATDTWQFWDALRGGDAIWWSTRDIPGVCAFNCFVSWSTILANNPNARIKFAIGFNVGSGWTGDYRGAADGLRVGVGSAITEFDFEPN